MSHRPQLQTLPDKRSKKPQNQLGTTSQGTGKYPRLMARHHNVFPTTKTQSAKSKDTRRRSRNSSETRMDTSISEFQIESPEDHFSMETECNR